MNLNPRHHNPELLEAIDEYYYCDHDQHDCDYYDSMWTWGDDTEYSDPNWIYYTWLITSDRMVVGEDSISDMDGCNVYKDGDDILDYEIYSYTSTNKTIGFFGAILKAQKETSIPSEKLIRLCNIMTDRYPELYIRLMDVI